jgi:hypothetical protein
MRISPLALACLTLSAQAAEPLLRPGQCVCYEEGGVGWVVTDPVFFVKGEVLAVEVLTRHLGKCPLVPGKMLAQYSRDEFNRHVLALPCVSPDVPERDEEVGVVRIRVTDWDTPHAKKAESAGRLYRGMFIGKKLEKGAEIELDANLLSACEQ